jgi:hypothetical protein
MAGSLQAANPDDGGVHEHTDCDCGYVLFDSNEMYSADVQKEIEEEEARENRRAMYISLATLLLSIPALIGA